jgi:hypothetical protein
VPLTPPRQLSLFGVEAAEPGPGDLAGLLAGPGQVERMGGTARVSVLVDAAWRVHVLVAELTARGLHTTWERVESMLAVRTAYTVALAPLAAAWLAIPPKTPPPGFFLDGPRLRLWVAAAGSQDPPGFLLRLGPGDEASWDRVGAALAGAGLPAVLVGPRTGTGPRTTAGRRTTAGPRTSAGPRTPAGARNPTDPPIAADPPSETNLPVATEPSGADSTGPAGPAYRIIGRRRLARLSELVGERPPAAPPGVWPGIPGE